MKTVVENYHQSVRNVALTFAKINDIVVKDVDKTFPHKISFLQDVFDNEVLQFEFRDILFALDNNIPFSKVLEWRKEVRAVENLKRYLETEALDFKETLRILSIISEVLEIKYPITEGDKETLKAFFKMRSIPSGDSFEQKIKKTVESFIEEKRTFKEEDVWGGEFGANELFKLHSYVFPEKDNPFKETVSVNLGDFAHHYYGLHDKAQWKIKVFKSTTLESWLENQKEDEQH